MSNNFQKHRDNIVRMPCLALPWKNLDFLKEIKLNKKFKTVCVVGMGGSSAGSKALITALNCYPEPEIGCVFLDNIDPDFVNGVLAKIDLKRTLFLLISKSGETIEIIFLAEILFKKIKSSENFIVITDNTKSPLAQMAKRRNIDILISPNNIPGRFSVLSIVGLLPAILTGIPAEEVLSGARKTNWRKAHEIALKQYECFKRNKNIAVIFPYCERLNYFADWYIQLLSESIGKSRNIGITAVKAMGACDQHSQLQLFLDGPDDKFFILIPPPDATKFPNLNNLFKAEYEGVKKALKKKKRVFIEIPVNKITPERLGELFFLFELEIAFLGSLFKINVQNQPAVELSKTYAKSILKSY